jgi:hypothetical protein
MMLPAEVAAFSQPSAAHQTGVLNPHAAWDGIVGPQARGGQRMASLVKKERVIL